MVVLHGMAGSGKTVLMAESLDDENLLHSCFPGGVFWLNIGRVDEARLLMKMQNLCVWLDSENIYQIPKNLEEARDRLRILFANEHPRCLLVLDDLWLYTDAKYFDVRVRTIVTTRYSAVADRINGLVLKVHIKENLDILQSQKILAQWTDLEVSQLPEEAIQIINVCRGSPLAISMIGALLKGHPNRWMHYLKQLQEQRISKVKSKLAYQYPSLYEAIAISFDNLTVELREHYETLAIFEEDMTLKVLTIFWDLDVSISSPFRVPLLS